MIRSVLPTDAAAICAIYNHYVQHTMANFEEQTIPSELMAPHIAGQVLAYAYAGPCPSYRGAADTTIYVAPGATGRGLGALIYRQLLDLLRTRGLHSALAGIVLPNRASVVLHERLGFRQVGCFEEVGRKNGQWLDVGYWQLKLS